MASVTHTSNVVAEITSYSNEAFEAVFTEDELSVWRELIDGASWTFCMEVHRALRCDYYWMVPGLDPYENPEYDAYIENSVKNVRESGEGEKKRNIVSISEDDFKLLPMDWPLKRKTYYIVTKRLALAEKRKSEKAEKKRIMDIIENLCECGHCVSDLKEEEEEVKQKAEKEEKAIKFRSPLRFLLQHEDLK